MRTIGLDYLYLPVPPTNFSPIHFHFPMPQLIFFFIIVLFWFLYNSLGPNCANHLLMAIKLFQRAWSMSRQGFASVKKTGLPLEVRAVARSSSRWGQLGQHPRMLKSHFPLISGMRSGLIKTLTFKNFLFFLPRRSLRLGEGFLY